MAEGTQGEKPLYKNPYLWGFLFGALLLLGLRPLQEVMLKAPPPIATVGEWSLTSHRGEPFGSEQLKGKVYVASYIFTTCPTLCPRITAQMKRVHEKYAHFEGAVQLVSFTVDPETDTPEVLSAYMKRNGIDDARWTFVTGARADLESLIVGQMKLAIGERRALDGANNDAANSGEDAQPPSLYDISHTGRLALFDQNGDLRATFTADEEGLAALGNATRLLVRKGPNP